MTEPTITRQDSPVQGRYVARIEGIDAEAELVYRHAAPKLIVAVHTEVPDAFRGRLIGRLLATRMVEQARKEGIRIVAQCPFVKAERQKHPEWADVFQD